MSRHSAGINPELDEDDETPVPSADASNSRHNGVGERRSILHALIFIDDLRFNLDAMYAIQVAASYYMDNSFMLLALRMFSHALLAKPDPEGVQDPVHAYFSYIFGSSFVCILLHVLFTPPTPGEATRGYMHGSLVLDFVGQTGPPWKLHLLLLDLLILVIQLVYLDATRKRKAVMARLQKARGQSSRSSDVQLPSLPAQDLDSEEQGVLRNQVQPNSVGLVSEPLDGIHLPQSSASGNDSEFSDRVHSGQAHIGTFWVLDLLKEKRRSSPSRPAYGPTTVLRSVVGLDPRQRRYSLNIPFRS